MCYSAKVRQGVRELEKRFNAQLDYAQVLDLFTRRLSDKRIQIPRAFEANFDDPRNPEDRQLKALTADYRTKMAAEWERQLFAQKKRLADAQRKLKDKETKAALNDERVAGNKVKFYAEKLGDLKRTEPESRDARIFPMNYAPIVLRENGETKIVLARYHCRQADKPESIDRKFPGLYNARRDNLEKFWRNEFGHTHAICVIDSFYENVARHDLERRELRPGEEPKNVVLQFEPKPHHEMIVACVYARSKSGDGDDLISFAAITDEPPPEIAAAGHDRCVINLKKQSVDAWLTPEVRNIAQVRAILGDIERPYYEHRVLEAA